MTIVNELFNDKMLQKRRTKLQILTVSMTVRAKIKWTKMREKDIWWIIENVLSFFYFVFILKFNLFHFIFIFSF